MRQRFIFKIKRSISKDICNFFLYFVTFILYEHLFLHLMENVKICFNNLIVSMEITKLYNLIFIVYTYF